MLAVSYLCNVCSRKKIQRQLRLAAPAVHVEFIVAYKAAFYFVCFASRPWLRTYLGIPLMTDDITQSGTDISLCWIVKHIEQEELTPDDVMPHLL